MKNKLIIIASVIVSIAIEKITGSTLLGLTIITGVGYYLCRKTNTSFQDLGARMDDTVNPTIPPVKPPEKD